MLFIRIFNPFPPSESLAILSMVITAVFVSYRSCFSGTSTATFGLISNLSWKTTYSYRHIIILSVRDVSEHWRCHSLSMTYHIHPLHLPSSWLSWEFPIHISGMSNVAPETCDRGFKTCDRPNLWSTVKFSLLYIIKLLFDTGFVKHVNSVILKVISSEQ